MDVEQVMDKDSAGLELTEENVDQVCMRCVFVGKGHEKSGCMHCILNTWACPGHFLLPATLVDSGSSMSS